MTESLENVRNLLNQRSNNSVTQPKESSSIFSFSQLEPGKEIRIRFIPDADSTNPFFWREHHARTFAFNSVLLPNGMETSKTAYVTVPAFNLKTNETALDGLSSEYLYKSNEDPIQCAIKSLWIPDDTASQKLYSSFSKKIRYVFQGFVRTEGYEQKVYRFIINKDLFALIKAGLYDSEIDVMPCNPERGRDFILKVTEKTINLRGQTKKVKDYSTSKWSGKESPLTESEIKYLEERGSFDLKDFIPKRPTAELESAMLDLYHCASEGQPYDVKRFGKVLKPNNLFFDEQGNIKGDNSAKMTELPTESKVNTTVNTVLTNSANKVSSLAEIRQMLVDSPVNNQTVKEQVTEDSIPNFEVPMQQVNEEKKLSAPQLISQVAESIKGSSKEEITNEIMAKLGLL